MGKESTSVGPSCCMWRALSSAISASVTSSTLTLMQDGSESRLAIRGVGMNCHARRKTALNSTRVGFDGAPLRRVTSTFICVKTSRGVPFLFRRF